MQILFTNSVLPTIISMDQIGGWGVLPYRPKMTEAYAFILLSRFHPSLTGLVVCVGEEWVTTAEMT